MTWRLGTRGLATVLGAAAMLLALPALIGDIGRAHAAEYAAPSERAADVSSSREAYDRFLGTALTLYKAASSGDARALSQSRTVLAYRYGQLPMPYKATEEGMRSLSDRVDRLGRLSEGAKRPDEQSLKAEAAAVYLAADAMANPQRPLWHDYRVVISDDLEALRKPLGADAKASERSVDYAKASEALRRLEAHYALVRTAALLGPSGEAALRADSALGYASTVLKAGVGDGALAESVWRSLNNAVLALFPSSDGQERSATIVPVSPGVSWAWSATMGTFIVTVLTWVGWLRYRSEPYTGAAGPKPSEDRKDAAESLLERWRNRRR